MKFINKYQDGGSVPFMVYAPKPQQGEQPSSQSQQDKKSSDDDSKLSNSIINKLLDNSIPSDAKLFLEKVSSFSNNLLSDKNPIETLLSTPEGFNTIMNDLISIKHNKDDLIKTKDNLITNGGLGEIAIDVSGNVIGRDKEGKISKLTLDQYSANKDNFQLLTNNELLELRAYDKNMAFNNSIISILKNGEGMENVRSTIQSTISNLKYQKSNSYSTIDPKTNSIIEGLSLLEDGVNIETTASSNRVHMKEALTYLYSTMPQNQRNLLKAKATQLGYDPNTGSLELISLMMTAGTSEEITQKLKATPGGSGSGSGSDSGTMKSVKQIENWVTNKGEESVDSIKLGGNYTMILPSYKFKRLETSDGKTFDTKYPSVEQVITSAFPALSTTNSVMFGDKILKGREANRVILDGSGYQKVYLPFDKKIYDDKKIYVPDLNLLKEYEKIVEKIKTNNITDKNEKINLFKTAGLLEYLNKDLEFDTNIDRSDLVQPFFHGTGIAQKGDVGFGLWDNISDSFEDVSDNYDNDVLSEMIKSASGDDKAADYWGISWVANDYISGNVFFHTSDDGIAASTQSGNLGLSKDEFNRNTVERKINESKSRSFVRQESENGRFTLDNLSNLPSKVK